MKHCLWIVSLICLLLSGAETSAQEPLNSAPQIDVAVSQSAFTAVVRKVRRLESVSYRVGWTLEAGEFHKLSEETLRYGSLEDLHALVKDESPILRVLGLICLARLVTVLGVPASPAPWAVNPTVEPEKQVRAFVEAFNARDIDGMLALADENVQWLSVDGVKIS